MPKKDFEESSDALDLLRRVLLDKLGLAYKLESRVKDVFRGPEQLARLEGDSST